MLRPLHVKRSANNPLLAVRIANDDLFHMGRPPPVPPEDPKLRLIIDTLPEKLRLPLVLSYAEGMDYQEIAETLHLTQTAVRGRIHRAKKELRKELEV